MNTPRKLLALVPLLLLPAACSEAKDLASQASDGVKAAGETISDQAGDLADAAKDMGVAPVMEGLKGLQPKIEDAIAKLKENSGSLTEGMKDKLSKLTEYKDMIPGLLEKLTDGSGEALTAALSKGKELLAELPKLLESLTGK